MAFMPELRGYYESKETQDRRHEEIKNCKIGIKRLSHELETKKMNWLKGFLIRRKIKALKNTIATHEHYLYYTWWES